MKDGTNYHQMPPLPNTMLKTPLPEKLGTKYIMNSNEADAINQLITYLAELTEMVEGKQNPNGCTLQTAGTPGAGHSDMAGGYDPSRGSAAGGWRGESGTNQQTPP